MIRRREFITLISGAAVAWPLAASAQQSARPIVGFLHSQSSDGFPEPIRGFRQGLKDAGFFEGENVAIDTGGLKIKPSVCRSWQPTLCVDRLLSSPRLAPLRRLRLRQPPRRYPSFSIREMTPSGVALSSASPARAAT